MRILLTAEQIADRIRELGVQISQDYGQSNPVLIGLLKGSVLFLADLMRALSIPHTIEFLRASSYGAGTTSSGEVRLSTLEVDLTERQVLIVEDIVDTGRTLQYITAYLLNKNPASLRVCALLDKPSARVFHTPVDYVGFSIPELFVVGYGLDWNEKYRHLPFIAVIEDKGNAHSPVSPRDSYGR